MEKVGMGGTCLCQRLWLLAFVLSCPRPSRAPQEVVWIRSRAGSGPGGRESAPGRGNPGLSW